MARYPLAGVVLLLAACQGGGDKDTALDTLPDAVADANSDVDTACDDLPGDTGH